MSKLYVYTKLKNPLINKNVPISDVKQINDIKTNIGMTMLTYGLVSTSDDMNSNLWVPKDDTTIIDISTIFQIYLSLNTIFNGDIIGLENIFRIFKVLEVDGDSDMTKLFKTPSKP